MMEENKKTKKTLVNKPRCPKGFIRDKTGNCVPKPIGKTEKLDKKQPKQPKQPKKSEKKEKPKENPTKNKTRKIAPKKMSKEEAVKLLKERRECIQRFREKL
jgi:hypothetical protein